ncbi:FtsK/SpoIIIE domain-containing protein [Yinghuangia soli]|uniref:Cell division protein FtsK n=1 Tax=Yinghuangia soli TaxID=2908204 RepID=A0AA41PWS8_9ACTN|nr:FtsK/SpoIIIE domain-containing protein [Yinghuangia soli]MCF2526626.1 cell division protein FtsK [Yinghuangia soli]
MTHVEPFNPDGDPEHGADVIPLHKLKPPVSDVDPMPDMAPTEDAYEVPVPVDAPAPARLSWRESVRGEKRQPILPAWLLSRDALKEQVRWVWDHYTHVFAFHAVRVPVYAGTLALRSPQGAGRLIGGAFRWVTDADGRPVRANAIQRADAAEYLKLAKHRDGRIRLRATILIAATLAVSILMTALILAGPTWGAVLAFAGIIGGLGFLGAPNDRPVVGPAVVKPQVQKLSSHIVLRALGALGIAGINQAMTKGWGPRAFVAPITRDGPGWRADVDLPYGVTAVDIMERRDRLASGLRRPMGCVWPEPVHDEHTGRLVLWVGDQDMNQVTPPAWPLARSGAASLFKPLPYGTDQRGRQILVNLMYANMLIGAMPGMGKTFALRILLLAAALDVTAELLVWELKGTGDLSPFEKVAADYGSGPDDETCEAALRSLRYVYKDLERRAKVIAGLPKNVCPENKVTPELAAKKSLRLHPLVLAIDECQELFAHEKFGKEAESLAVAVIKRGRALGVILVLATQRPDKESLPTGVSANVGIRFCLKVMGQLENDMILGTSSYKNGLRATTFTLKDKGIGYLVGAAPDAQITRTYAVDNDAADKICDRARAAREAAGTLTGYAAGQTTDTDRGLSYDLLADVLAVIPPSEPKVWNEVVVDRLAELRPDGYGTWAALDVKAKSAQLTTALKPYGVPVGQVWGTDDATGKGANRRGITRDDVTASITKREGSRGSD